MKHSLTSSEKRLFVLCLAVILAVGVFFAWRNHRTRMTAVQEKLENLRSRFTAAVAASGDAPFWKERQAWLDAKLPAMGDQGQAHSSFLEQLQGTARERGLAVTSLVLLKPEAGPNHRELAITIQLSGPDNALYRWLAEIQSPEKFQVVKYLLLTPVAGAPARMSCSATLARYYKP